MTRETGTEQTEDALRKLSARLSALLDTDPAEAVRQARALDPSSPNRLTAIALRAPILVDGGAACRDQGAIEQGLELFRELHGARPNPHVAYNLANALAAVVGEPAHGLQWLDHQELTRAQRAEARRLYWGVARSDEALPQIRTQAWTNLANQLSKGYRLGEAHDARLEALGIDPSNGVAAGSAARDLIWLYNQGGCSDLTRIEVVMLAKIAKQHRDRVREYAGEAAANNLAELADALGDAPARSPHSDPFVRWVERERLTLAPAVELVDPALGKLDWLMLPAIREREAGPKAATPPPVFAMFNAMKADFILARDLAWRATDNGAWPTTGRFADTLDFATYGPDASALILAHRTALDLLDKVAVTANHYFEIGQAPNKVSFGRLWRKNGATHLGVCPLVPPVEKAIRRGASALYGLAELADDYDAEGGILRSQKDLRNAGTHRFVVLHDIGDLADIRSAPAVEHYRREVFANEVMRALRVGRSALQMLALAIRQNEHILKHGEEGHIGTMIVPDHDWVRGREENQE
ncbi:MAG: LA2681 family HEPN domain-containing protein [Myxococcales bacterium]